MKKSHDTVNSNIESDVEIKEKGDEKHYGNRNENENRDGDGGEKSSTKEGRRDFMLMAASAVGCVGLAAAAVPFVSSLWPDASVVASGKTEVDLSKIDAGEAATVMWRGNPIFVIHRTQAQIKEAQEVDISTLKDPELDSVRVKKGREEWLVVVAVCTHLGCVPINNKGDYSGSLCPCHGSQYDSSGRIRQGPAPKNLEVPPYEFVDGNRLVIG